jgi:hypothetical protein
MKCAALGCQKAPGKNGLFCLGCWRRLPEELRGPTAARQAVVHLGKLDGYIAVHDPKPKIGEDGAGREYV